MKTTNVETIKELIEILKSNGVEIDACDIIDDGKLSTDIDILKVYPCCICGKRILGYGGNNPWPYMEDGDCCNQCNNSIVLALRIKL